MPRSGDTYTFPSNSASPAVAGTAIDASDFNDVLDDVESALTGSVSREVLLDTSDAAKGDARVGVKRTETGASATTLHAWIQTRRCSIRDFGADSTDTVGTTNVTAINAAITAMAAAGGGVVQVPVAAWWVNAEIRLKDYVILEGEGTGSVLKLVAATELSKNGLIVNDTNYTGPYDADAIPTSQNVGCGVRNLTLDGDYTNQAGSTDSGIYFGNVRYGLIENVTAKNWIKHGIELWGCNYTSVVGSRALTNKVSGIILYKKNNYCRVEGCEAISNGAGGSTGSGIIVDNQSNTNVVTACRSVSNLSDGINVSEGSSGNVVTGNQCDSNSRYGISLSDGQSGLLTQNNTISSNYINGSGSHGIWNVGCVQSKIIGNSVIGSTASGIYLQKDTTSGRVCDDAVIEGNTIKTSGNYGIYVEHSARVMASGNNVSTSGFDGIKYTDSTFGRADGNIVFNANSAASATNYAGIRFSGTSDYLNASNNLVYATDATNYQQFGIWTEAATVTNSMIVGNRVYNSKTQNIPNNDTSAVIFGNTGQYTATATWDPGNCVVGAVVTTTVTVTGARAGDMVHVSHTVSLSGLELTGYVSANDTVTVVLSNNTAADQDLASGTLKVVVDKR